MSHSIDSLASEVAHIRKELDDLKAIVNPSTGQTTKEQRKALRHHIEKLDQELKKPKKKPRVNEFKPEQTVDMVSFHPGRERGVIQIIACKEALPSIKKCDKKTCAHEQKNYCWVLWPNKKLFAYHFTDLKLVPEDDLKPRIGRELSGRIGEWTYNHETKLWKKDGSDKEYTESEFDTEMYFEMNPDEKEDAEKFIRAIMQEKHPEIETNESK